MSKDKKSVATKEARKKTPNKQGWRTVFGVILMLIWVATSVIASQFVIGYLMIWILGTETFTRPVATAVYSALSYVVAMLLIIMVPTKLAAKWRQSKKGSTKMRREEAAEMRADRVGLGLRDWPTWTDIGLAPVGFVVYLLIAAGLTAVFSAFPWFDAEQAQDVGFSIYISGVDRLIAFITLVVVAPIAEEVIFRGWLYGKLRSKLNGQIPNVAGMLMSILLTSLLFGTLHMQWNVGVNVFAMSVVLCGLREVTGTIYAGILLHMLKNGVAFYLLYVLGMG